MRNFGYKYSTINFPVEKPCFSPKILRLTPENFCTGTYLLRATFEGMDIDVNQAEDAYGRCGGQWVPLGTNLTHRQRVPLFDLHVWVQPLEDLIAYKALIGRSADVVALRVLQHRLRA
jgi:hypothetical protein